MEPKKICIIGGSGFVGRYLVKELASAGHQVKVLCRHPSRATFLKVSGNVAQVVCDYMDITKPDTLTNQFNGFDSVINLLGIASESGTQTFRAIQEKGAALIAKEAKRAGVPQFIQMSALGVERAKGSLYAKTKLAGEQAVLSTYADATIIRPSVIFGAEDTFINLFAKLGTYSALLPLIGNGTTLFQPVYVDDVARAMAHIVNQPHLGGKIYELGGPQKMSLRAILSYISHTTGRRNAFIPIPFFVAAPMGRILSLAPGTPLTSDQVRLLKSDSILHGEYSGLRELNIEPTAMDVIVPHYLQYRKKAA